MSETTQLGLPLLQPSQAQKHVTVNEAMTVLDTVVQLSVKGSALNAPPSIPAEGDRYIVGPAPTGSWSGKPRQIGAWVGGVWMFFPPGQGWIAWDETAGEALVFTGANWQSLLAGSLPNTVADFGIGASPDVTNKFVFSGTNSLFTSVGSLDLTMNKAASGNDASLTFKNSFSSRALLGLLANDNFTLKVSNNGTSFATPLVANAASGKISTLLATANGLQLSDGTDPTKVAQFSLAGIATGTTRTFGLPDTSQTLAHIGGASQTFAGPVTLSNATVSLGTSVATATYSLGDGATGSGVTKTINLGTSGVSGSTTIVNVGSTISGAGGSFVVNSPTVTFANSVTAIGMAQANLSAGRVGVGGATADATNRLSVNSSNVLLNNAGTSIDLSLNKATSGDDASVTFKSGFSARALLGLMASEDLTLKVSPDGTAYFDGLTVDRTTGRVSFPQGARLGPLASDPLTPADGTIWYNSTTTQMRARINGATRILASDDTAFIQPGTGDYVSTSMGSGSAFGTAAGVTGRFDLFPFVPRGDFVSDQIAINVTTAVAAAQGKLVVYGSNVLGQPTTRLFESAALDFSTTGFKTATLSVTFRKGQVYWIGMRHSSTATTTTFAASATPDLTTSDLNVQLRKVLRRTLTFSTAAPDPWGYLSTETANGSAVSTYLRSV